MQGCTCKANEDGAHKFKPMMVESVPPVSSLMETIGINDSDGDGNPNFDADDRTKLILALTTRKYAIVCESCGFFAGGFKGNVEDENSVASE